MVEIETIELPSIDYVMKALNKTRISPDAPQFGETATHGLLKDYGVHLLKLKHPLLKICREYRYPPHIMPNQQGYCKVDVAGISDVYNVAIECGNTSNSKVKKLSKFFDKIILLPYTRFYPDQKYLIQINQNISEGHSIDVSEFSEAHCLSEDVVYGTLHQLYKRRMVSRRNMGSLDNPVWVFYPTAR